MFSPMYCPLMSEPQQSYDGFTTAGAARKNKTPQAPKRIKPQGETNMNNYQFGVTGQDRKDLVAALSEILNIPKKYLGGRAAKFQVGNLIIDQEGTVTGELTPGTLTALAECGFVPENAIEPEMEIKEEPAAPEFTNALAIEMPLAGFTPESLDNLTKMVDAKAVLIKKSLGVADIPIRVRGDRIVFDWFNEASGEILTAYSQFITLLCDTAKEKKRVTAKVHESFENEKFAMRVWLIGLGMIGAEFSFIRKIMAMNLGGDGAWRYGKPEHLQRRATQAAMNNPLVAAAFAPQNAAATPTPADTQADNKEEYVADIAARNAANASDNSAGEYPADKTPAIA